MNIRAKIHHEHYYVDTPMRILKETNEHFFAVRDLSYLWLKSIGKLNWLEKLQLESYDMRVYHYAPISSVDTLPPKHSWIADFPLKEEDLLHFDMISLFFEWIIDDSFISDFKSSCEYAVKRVGESLPKPLLIRMVHFLLGQPIFKNERVRLMHSSSLTEFII